MLVSGIAQPGQNLALSRLANRGCSTYPKSFLTWPDWGFLCTYIRGRNAIQSAESMETCSRTGPTFLASMAFGMFARTKCVKVAPGKTKQSEVRGGSIHFARHTTESWPMRRVIDVSGRRRTSLGC